MINLLHGDCLDLIKDLPNGCADMALIDLPYGTTHCPWDCTIDLNLMWNELQRVVKEDGAMCFFAQTPFDKVLGMSNLENLRYEWIWEKPRATGHYNANIAPMKAHENILVFYRKPPTYNPQFTEGHKKNSRWTKMVHVQNGTTVYNQANREYSGGGNTVRYPRSVLTFSTERGLHDTQKPVLLCEYLIRTYTNPGETVIDLCMGSGTTGIACINSGRRFIGMELNEEIFNTASERIDKRLSEGIQVELT